MSVHMITEKPDSLYMTLRLHVHWLATFQYGASNNLILPQQAGVYLLFYLICHACKHFDPAPTNYTLNAYWVVCLSEVEEHTQIHTQARMHAHTHTHTHTHTRTHTRTRTRTPTPTPTPTHTHTHTQLTCLLKSCILSSSTAERKLI